MQHNPCSHIHKQATLPWADPFNESSKGTQELPIESVWISSTEWIH